jgi:glycosyltransferase involved in cell wall biosynthesis
MHVCIVTARVVVTDGQGRANYEIARHLAGAGHRVTLLTSELDSQLAAHPHVEWRRIPCPRSLPTELLRNQLFAAAASRAISALGGCDVLHLNGFTAYRDADVNTSHFVHASWLRSPYLRSDGAGLLANGYQHLYAALNARLERSAYQRSRRVVAVSRLVREWLVGDVGLPGEQIEVISNGVDAELFRPLAPGEPNRLRQALRLQGDELLLVFAGDLRTRRKNLDLPLAALARLDARFHLAVIGDATGSPYPREAEALGVGARVHFLGQRSDVPDLMRGADVLTFASHHDPFALVVLEAMASGLPVITAPSTGASALIESGQNGLVLRDDLDLEGMRSAILRLAADRAFARELGRAARRTAERCSWRANAAAYEHLYRRIWSEKQARLGTPERSRARARARARGMPLASAAPRGDA